MVRVVFRLFALLLFFPFFSKNILHLPQATDSMYQVILKSKWSFIGIRSLNKQKLKWSLTFRSGKASAVKKHYFLFSFLFLLFSLWTTEQSDQYLPHQQGVPCGGSRLDGGVSHRVLGICHSLLGWVFHTGWVAVRFVSQKGEDPIQLIGAAEEEGAIPCNGYLWRVNGRLLFETERCW